MVLALAGDSTMTSDVPPAGAGSRSSSISTGAALRAVTFFTALFLAAAFLAGAFFAAVLVADLAATFLAVLVAAFFVGISSVNQGTLAAHGAIIEPDVIRHGADVRQSDAAVNMDEGTLHQVFEVVQSHGA